MSLAPIENRDRRSIEVTAKNLWFLEKSIPLFGLLDFFPKNCIGAPEFNRAVSHNSDAIKLTIETDQGWSFSSDITSDSRTFRNKSRNRGTGRWVVQAAPKPGDRIILTRLGEYHYRLELERV